MSDVVCPQTRTKAPGETRNCAVEYLGSLDPGELLAGTPTVIESTGDITITNVARNTATKTVDGRECVPGQAVQFTVADGESGRRYTITVTCDTDAGQLAVERRCMLEVL